MDWFSSGVDIFGIVMGILFNTGLQFLLTGLAYLINGIFSWLNSMFNSENAPLTMFLLLLLVAVIYTMAKEDILAR